MKKFNHLQNFLKLMSYHFNTRIMISAQILNKYHIDKYNYDQEFVKLLLGKYYKRIKNIFNNKEEFIYVQLSNDEYIILDSLANFIKKSEILITNNSLSTKEIKHFNYLKSLIDYNKSKEQIKEETLKYYYQQQYHKIANYKIVSILSLEP